MPPHCNHRPRLNRNPLPNQTSTCQDAVLLPGEEHGKDLSWKSQGILMATTIQHRDVDSARSKMMKLWGIINRDSVMGSDFNSYTDAVSILGPIRSN